MIKGIRTQKLLKKTVIWLLAITIVLYGVSGFQLHFGSEDVHTPGDMPDVLVAMNPAALKKNLGELHPFR